ncbi:MAG: cytochrome c family protein, partial [Steroidobacteraceae bacterium]|nr:cytochrome c family protein [Steroidobacteraceae bacterium]
MAASGKVEAQYQGVASCAQSFCHGAARPLTATRVLQNEYTTWIHFDPHARAFAVLRSESSRRMARRLGIGDPAQAPQCLACHADPIAAPLRGARFQLDDGVGCETCHGAAQRWLAS